MSEGVRQVTLREMFPEELLDRLIVAATRGTLTREEIHAWCKEEKYAAEFERRGVVPTYAAYAFEYALTELSKQ